MKVLVLLEVEVPDNVLKTDVREHVRDQVLASRGMYSSRNDWRADIDVRLKRAPRP